MQGSKIVLSPAEAALFANADVILTKNEIIRKTVALLSSLQDQMPPSLPSTLRQTTPAPKISKGENYLGLPYVVLDYPRRSGENNLLFVRSFFWWGNFYSSTLQLSGAPKARCMPTVCAAYERLCQKNYFLGINADPWIHHFQPDNYRPVHAFSKDDFCATAEEMYYLKLAVRWPLAQWESAEKNLWESWTFLTGLVA